MQRLALACCLALASCATTSESASGDTLTSNVGQYSSPPSNIVRPRVGIPAFSVTGKNAKAEMNEVAADQISTLLVRSQRFDVIERAQLDKILAEQNLAGVVKPGELPPSGQVRGVDYLLIGKVSNMRVKTEKTTRGFGLAKIGGLIGVGAADVEKEEASITTECGVDLRLVDPASGQVVAANFSEYKRVDSASAMGVEVFGFDSDAGAEVTISDDDYGKILRLALDDAVRKMLPDVDQFLLQKSRGG